jgi:cob(I)alamin adenosyltransferase
MTKGLIHVYTGHGKGKTTASFGLAMRAAGHGRRVLILQFLKSRTKNAGEIIAAKKCGIKVIKFSGQTSPLFDPSIKRSELKKAVNEAIKYSIEEIKSRKYDLIVLEEFNNVVSNGYTTIATVKRIVKAKPDDLELVFTGRNAPAELVKLADYVTEMRMIKHPADNGIMARKGIEF